jgi:hypothetical protein
LIICRPSQGRIQIDAIESRLRLGDGRLQASTISYSVDAAALLDDMRVQGQDFLDRLIPHYASRF